MRALLFFTSLGVFSIASTARAADRPQPRVTKAPEAAEPTAPAPDEGGFGLGARLGYALPMGSVAKDPILNGANDLSKYASGMIPLWIDAGYHVNRHVYVGAWFQFALLSTSGDVCTRAAGTASCSSSGNDLRFGVTARYNFNPEARFDPWIGAGVGYEIMNISATVGNVSADATMRGFEYASLQLGGDFKVLPEVSVGPLVMFSLGQYGSYDYSRPGVSLSGDFTKSALHEWMFFGLRGEYAL